MLGKECTRCSYDLPLDCFPLIRDKGVYRSRNTCVRCHYLRYVKDSPTRRVARAVIPGSSKEKSYRRLANKRYRKENRKKIDHSVFRYKKVNYFPASFSHPELLQVMIDIRRINLEHERLLKEAVGKRCNICFKDKALTCFSLSDGKYRSSCKICTNVKSKKIYQMEKTL